MARSSRAKSDASQPRSPTARKSIQLSPRQSTKLDDYREGQLRSPTSPTARRAPKRDLFDEPLPSTPEEWIEFAQTKLRRAAASRDMSEIILDLAEIEPDLLEFLITADEEIRDTISEALCKLPFPTTREAWRESIFSSLLERFRVFFNRLPPRLVDRKVDDEGRQFTYLTTALDALDHLGFGDPSEFEQEAEQADPFFKVKSTSQKKRKASISIANRARRNTAAVDPRVFKAVDVEFPATLKEAMDIQSNILLRLQEVLEVFLVSFANPELSEHAKALFLKDPVNSIIEILPVKQVPATIVETPVGAMTTAPDPGDLPHVRPLAAAKYFDEGPTMGAWPIVVAGRAVADLRRMRKRDAHAFELVHKKITELSEGQFSENNQKRLAGIGLEVPIYEAKVSRDARIVYQIDLETDMDAKVDRQIIKIYGIYTDVQLDNRMWSQISYDLDRRGKGYIQRCLYRSVYQPQGKTITMPALFSHQDVDAKKLVELPPYRAQGQNSTDDDELNLRSLLTLEKFIPMSRSLITAILNDTDTNHLFQPSPKEKEIIYHDSACCVLGRSGTGKTTCIVFKMLGIEIMFDSMKEFAKPRQVFVTQSRVLAQRVQEYYQKLVKSSFDTLVESSLGANEEQVLADLEDEDASAFGLPPKFSMLEDHHFPLFLSFDQLCSLLEADFGIYFGQSISTKTLAAVSHGVSSTISVPKQEDEAAELDPNIFSPSDFATEALEDERNRKSNQAIVNFDKFLVAYWPRFDERRRKGLDPALVYSEFLGVIEGSEAALRTKSGALSREEYTHGNQKRATFAAQRDCIYDLYEAYRKRRGQLWNYDVAERTHALVKATNSGVPGKKFDCLYIDEAQDNLLIDIKLLHNLSNNPHGLFMAGDTAQTISAGSSFRFEDLTAFMWRLEEKAESVRRRKRSAIHPTLFHLAINYRSHQGIVDCASSVVELISDLFPDSIDKLDKESGLDGGPPPVFFSGWERGVVRFEQFLRGGSNIRIDFGASQAILVRNDAARTALREQMGEIGLILTLYESKGLEFDDVLLYNFFEDSLPSASTWRIVLAGIGTAPNFDELRHSVICAELKHLYVGLTRARKHCWIWDVSDKAEPMKTVWTKYGLVSHCGPGDPIPQLGVSSSHDAWSERGRSLFNKQLYSQAAFCFDKAELVVERDIATAYESRKQARLLQAATSTNQAAQTFISTATAFMECAKRSVKKQQLTCYMRAAECFMEGGAWKPAAEAFLCAGDFDSAAKNYRRAGCFDEAVDVVKRHRGQMEETVAEEVIEVAKLEYLRTDKFQQAEELFENVEDQLEYMGDYGFNAAQIHVLENEQRYEEAAGVAFGEHHIMEGIHFLLRSEDPGHTRQAVERALNSLWTLLPIGWQRGKLDNVMIEPLIRHLENSKSALNKGESRQLEVFQILQNRDNLRLISLAQSSGIVTRQSESHRPTPLTSIVSLLCFSYGSDLLVPTADWTIFDFISKSKLALCYFSELVQLAKNLNLSCSNTQRLLGFEPRESHAPDETGGIGSATTEFWIHSTSMMFNYVPTTAGVHDSVQSDLGLSSKAASEADTYRLVKSAIYNTLQLEIRKIGLSNTLDYYSAYLDPCLAFAVFGYCDRDGCRKQHVNSFKLSNEQRQEAFNLRAQALIAQLEIIHAHPTQNIADSWILRRTWSRQAYEVLMPYFPPMGGLLCLDQNRAPEKERASQLISIWCEDALYYVDIKYGATVLSDVLVYLDLAFRIEGKSTKFAAYVDKLYTKPLVNPRADLMWSGYPAFQRSIIQDFIDFYARRSDTVLSRIVHATRHIVTRQLTIEANVLVQLLESVTREVIIHYRRWTHGPHAEGKILLDQMLVPRSWAVDMIARPPLLMQRPFPLFDFLNTLYKMIELLHAHEMGSSRVLLRFGGPLNLLMRAILIMRVCRMLILVAITTNLPPHDREFMKVHVGQILSSAGNLHVVCARFARAESWIDFQDALAFSPLNRGADELVFLSLRRDSGPPPFIHSTKTISYANIFPELAQALSLNGTTKPVGTQLNPRAAAFVPSAAVQASKPKAPNRPYSNAFAVLASSEADPMASEDDLEPERTLTAEEIQMGKRILRCYKEYRGRQQTRAREAARIIWAYYSRHRLRHLPQTATGDMLQKLHIEYMRDVGRLVYPPLLAKSFHRHKQILLGCMPHVIIYLRGLEEVNRHELATKKKELVTADHKYLEKIQARINGCGTFAKKIKVLIHELSPGSSLLNHLDSLQQRVRHSSDARQSITQAFDKDAFPADLDHHYVLGVETILAPGATPSASQPMLGSRS